MPRDSEVRLDDTSSAIGRIRRHIGVLTVDQFVSDEKSVDAVVRCLEIIGEAVKNLPAELTCRQPDIQWARNTKNYAARQARGAPVRDDTAIAACIAAYAIKSALGTEQIVGGERPMPSP